MPFTNMNTTLSAKMRCEAEIGLDPVTDRAKMYMNTVQIPWPRLDKTWKRQQGRLGFR